MSGFDFDDLAEGATPEERARMRRAHDLLVTAGPPPELPPHLAEAPLERPEKPPALTTLPRRRFGAFATAAVGVAAAAFLVGYIVSGIGSSGETKVVRTIPMRPTAAAPHSAAVIDVLEGGEGGNIPLNLTVSGLRKLPEGSYYELWLTRVVKGKQQRVVSCGTFVANTDRLEVALNAPYRLEDGKPGWIVTRHERGAKASPVVLTTPLV
ncbi:MAG: anti-sigma factor [Gaiellaceae bacterium]